MELDHKNIVLTGAAAGIGLAVLKRLAGCDARIMAVDLNAGALQTACGALKHVIPYQCDLSTPENVDRLFDEALKTLGSVDIFIANAGFAYFEAISQPDWAHIERIYRVNVFNAIYTVEKMQALNGNRPHKTVITASAMAHIAVPGYALYSPTKAALDRFAEAYRWQLADPRSLLLVYPIATRTGFFEAAGSGVPTPWPSQTPEKVARAILRGIERDQKSVYPSRVFQLVLFLDRFLPMHWLVQKIEQGRFAAWQKRN
jgi:uncharacterized protein